MPDPKPKDAPATPPEVRYSLPELLRELQLEREASAFALERVDQSDINRLFTKKRTRRGLKSRK